MHEAVVEGCMRAGVAEMHRILCTQQTQNTLIDSFLVDRFRVKSASRCSRLMLGIRSYQRSNHATVRLVLDFEMCHTLIV